MKQKTDHNQLKHKSGLHSQKINIGIIGAGPAGLMTALALEHYVSQDRVNITILDRNASANDYPGVEYGIQARACRALERIGLLEQALERGNPCTEITFLNARLNKRFRSIKSDPKYTRCVVRQEFLADLEGLLQHSELKRRHIVKEIVPSANGTALVMGDIAGSEGCFSHDFDILVAADGVHSVVRKSLFPQAAMTYHRGFSCIYMLVESETETAPEGFLQRANSGRSELIMGHFSTLTMFPMGKGRLALGIGFDDATKASLWKQHDLSPDTPWASIPERTKKEIAVALASDAGDVMFVKALDLISNWNSHKIYHWAMRDTDPLPKPYTDTGNIVVIGDAAHAIMPTIGMGASLAIEDAEALACKIGEAVRAAENVAAFRASVSGTVLAPFTHSRYPVWHELISRARLAAKGNFIGVGNRKRFAIGPQIPNNKLSRMVSAIEWAAEKLGV